MSEEKPLEKFDILSQLASIFEIDGVSVDDFVSEAQVKKLSEKMGKTVNVTMMGFLVAETGNSAALIMSPESNKSLLIASGKDVAKVFLDALKALSEEKAK